MPRKNPRQITTKELFEQIFLPDASVAGRTYSTSDSLKIDDLLEDLLAQDAYRSAKGTREYVGWRGMPSGGGHIPSSPTGVPGAPDMRGRAIIVRPRAGTLAARAGTPAKSAAQVAKKVGVKGVLRGVGGTIARLSPWALAALAAYEIGDFATGGLPSAGDGLAAGGLRERMMERGMDQLERESVSGALTDMAAEREAGGVSKGILNATRGMARDDVMTQMMRENELKYVLGGDMARVREMSVRSRPSATEALLGLL